MVTNPPEQITFICDRCNETGKLIGGEICDVCLGMGHIDRERLKDIIHCQMLIYGEFETELIYELSNKITTSHPHKEK